MAVRPSGGVAGNIPVIPSVNEVRREMRSASKMGIDTDLYRQISGGGRNHYQGMLAPNTSAWQGLPTASSRGEFSEVLQTHGYDSHEYYDPKSYDYTDATNLAGLPISEERLLNRKYYDVDEDDTGVVIPGAAGHQGYSDSEAPAALSVVPTSTTNPKRPRTVAAGYDKGRNVITVVFRDGTWYNYYDCDPRTWQDFKARVSKGQYIYKYLDFHPRGPADVSAFSAAAQEMMYRVVRTAQIHLKGKQMKTIRPSTTTKPTNQKR